MSCQIATHARVRGAFLASVAGHDEECDARGNAVSAVDDGRHCVGAPSLKVGYPLLDSLVDEAVRFD